MLTKCDFLNKDGVTLYSLNSETAPLKMFDPSIEERVDVSRHRSQQDGINPTQQLRSYLQIHCEGDLFGNDAADYWANRTDFLTALFGDPNIPPDLTDRKAGTLILRFDGTTEDWQTDVAIMMFSAPIAALMWARSEYAVTFASWTPWLVGATTGTRYNLV